MGVKCFATWRATRFGLDILPTHLFLWSPPKTHRVCQCGWGNPSPSAAAAAVSVGCTTESVRSHFSGRSWALSLENGPSFCLLMLKCGWRPTLKLDREDRQFDFDCGHGKVEIGEQSDLFQNLVRSKTSSSYRVVLTDSGGVISLSPRLERRNTWNLHADARVPLEVDIWVKDRFHLALLGWFSTEVWTTTPGTNVTDRRAF